ncbi:MAG: PAS domain S-box protein [Candidatus Methylomirabilis oxygeniifera]|uniref:histidine kinase n=1 Tax=Methylomirabilis oxygeniifera TaxID=671143 RepID=D5MM34_METO1|nr:MAG: PAS domain S-box protein [Candidatus Methylomirabilis oxyfera]CBE67920.1 putative Nitrogen assimilation transcription regulation protein (ntrB) (synonyms:glnR, glnL) [Candidatus Methylomirabilis oxyfera]
MRGESEKPAKPGMSEVKRLRQRCEELSTSIESMRAYYEDLLGSLQDGIIIVESDGHIRSINQAAEELTGLSAQMVHGRLFEQIFPNDRPLQELVRKTMESGRTHTDFDGRLTRQDSSQVVISAVASLISDGTGQARGTVLALRDQTGIRELEERLQRSDRLAALGTVAAGVAHEIRNPLAGLRGAAQLLEGEPDFPPALREYTSVIVKEVDRLGAIVERLLSFATPRGPVLRSCNLHEILDGLFFLERAPLGAAKVTIQRQYDPQLPEILADPSEIQQLFLNLIHNGVEAMPDGGDLTVRTRYERSVKRCGGRSVAVVEIIDRGSGFDPEVERRLFTPFFTTKERGTGLGLAICLRIVEDHGGAMEATSSPGRGSRFCVWLPLAKQPEVVSPHNESNRTMQDMRS